jgi:glyoxylase-like metal-dependent hydrolase (beta-lactamase superfamily II)
MIIKTFPVGPLECNCSILVCEETKEAVILDPGGDADRILETVRELDAKVRYAIHTHAHVDHIAATREVAEATGCEIVLHKEDLFLYDDLPKQLAWLTSIGMPLSILGMKEDDKTAPAHKLVEDEQEILFGKMKLKVLHTPGHTPGSICFRHEAKEARLFSGDTLFAMGIGRTDLWGGSFPQIIDSIKGRIFRFDDDTAVLPGHGPATTVGMERRVNPFLI